MGIVANNRRHKAPLYGARVNLTCCVPGTAHVLKGESIIATLVMIDKSQTQPDGGEGCSVIATGNRRRFSEGGGLAAAG